MAKPDPRREPTVPPAEGEESTVQRVSARPPPEKVEKIEKIEKIDNLDKVDKAAAAAKEAAKDTSASEKDSEPEPTSSKSSVTSSDPRYEALEKLLDVNDWRGIEKELGAMEEAGKLPPNLGLVAALAHVESAKEASPEAITTAIRCMAGLLGVPESSPLARVLARRLLRKNPVRLTQRQAPPARYSVLIVALTLAIGGAVGWALSFGTPQGLLRVLHLM